MHRRQPNDATTQRLRAKRARQLQRSNAQEARHLRSLAKHTQGGGGSLLIKRGDYVRRDQILRSMGYPSYKHYLQSPTWAKIRRQALRDNNNTCFLCGARANTAHHATYSPKALRQYDPAVMIALCWPCHNKTHDGPGGAHRAPSGSVADFGRSQSEPAAAGRPTHTGAAKQSSSAP